MERWRRALLLVAINFAALHLALWSPLALVTGYDLIRYGVGARGPALALVLVLGLLGAVGVALPLRALWSGGRVIGAALVLAGLLYAPVAASGLLMVVTDRPSLLSATLEGAEPWVVVVFLMVGGLLGSTGVVPAFLAAAYAGSLVLGGVLTYRSAPGAAGVDGRGDRR